MTRTAEDFQAPSPKPESKAEKSPTPPPTEKRSMLLPFYAIHFIATCLIFNLGIIPQVYVKHQHRERSTIRILPRNGIIHLERRRVPNSSNSSNKVIKRHPVEINGMEPITSPISPPLVPMHLLDCLYQHLGTLHMSS